MIDLEDLLHGSPSWDDVVEFWKNGEFYSDEYHVPAIKKYLRTEEQRKVLYELDYSIEEILNGRYQTKHSRKINKIFKDWNKKLGFDSFGVF